MGHTWRDFLEQRLANWPRLLAEYLAANRHRSFEFGVFDCCVFAAGAIQSMTGKDSLEAYRGSVTDARTSARLLDDNGGLGKMVGDILSEVPISFAQRGDIVLMDSPDGRGVLGVCTGSDVAYVQAAGIELVPLLSTGRKAFRWG